MLHLSPTHLLHPASHSLASPHLHSPTTSSLSSITSHHLRLCRCSHYSPTSNHSSTTYWRPSSNLAHHLSSPPSHLLCRSHTDLLAHLASTSCSHHHLSSTPLHHLHPWSSHTCSTPHCPTTRTLLPNHLRVSGHDLFRWCSQLSTNHACIKPCRTAPPNSLR